MTTRDQALRSRRRLDERLRALGPAERYAPPYAGWLRAVREALGMSLADVAQRLGVATPSVRSMELNERSGTIQLRTLRRAAEAMDCTLVYALVPNSSLEATVTAQAERVVDAEVHAAARSMALEAQGTDLAPAARQAMVERLVASGRVWRRP